MKTRKVLGLALLSGLLATAAFSGTAEAYRGNCGWGGAQLTPEQQTAAQEIYSQHDKAAGPLYQQLAAKRAELEAQRFAEKPDSGKVQGLFREIADIEARLFTINTEFRSRLSDKGIACPGGGGGYHNQGYGGYHGGRHNGGSGYGYGGHGRGYGHRGGW